MRLDGLQIVVDCAQGASSQVAPTALTELGANVHAYYHEPDGTNINDNCGSTHPERLCELVRELGADIGLAFDGDADRLIAVDERGQLVNGDQVMAICAVHMKKQVFILYHIRKRCVITRKRNVVLFLCNISKRINSKHRQNKQKCVL